MKRKIILLAMLPVLVGLITLQSCRKDYSPSIKEHFSFSTPTIVAPDDGATVHLGLGVSTVTLQWNSTNESGDAVKADVYFGTEAIPPLYAADQTALSVANVPVQIGATYYWHVIMKDVNGRVTYGPTWSFTIFDPVAIFVGNFNADEPAESYSYGVSFVKTNDSTITTDNYWNSGWSADFILNLANNTYHMNYTVWGTYAGIESGTINQTTGTMVGTYSIYHPVTPAPGTVIEAGTHTYTKL